MLHTNLKSNNTLILNKHWDALAVLYQASIDHKLPVALWRYPNGDVSQGVVDLSGTVQPVKIDFTKNTPGFAFAPFVNEGGRETLFINADLYLNRTGLQIFPTGRDGNSQVERNKIRFLDTFQDLIANPQRAQVNWFTAPQSPQVDSISTKEAFCRLVQDAIAYIQATGIKKIVTSRATETLLPPNFDPVTAFELLCSRYPHAFVSLVSIPTIGTWLGASPELLLSLSDQKLCTVALAGTQAHSPDVPLSAVHWGTKEIEEQALVSDYIREFFQQLALSHFVEDGPRTVAAGNVVHLQTKFEIKLNPAQLLHLANQVLNKLHPTSAVCGMPKKEALSFILEKENYNRSFYSGFLGPIHLHHQSQLFVNLRCMQLKQDRAVLYVGGGITQDSVPELEWEETVLKSKTLLAILQPELAAVN